MTARRCVRVPVVCRVPVHSSRASGSDDGRDVHRQGPGCVRGRPAYRVRPPRASLRQDARHRRSQADLAYTTGTFAIADQTDRGAITGQTGSFVAIWRRVDGQWALQSLAGGSPRPAAVAPPTSAGGLGPYRFGMTREQVRMNQVQILSEATSASEVYFARIGRSEMGCGVFLFVDPRAGSAATKEPRGGS